MKQTGMILRENREKLGLTIHEVSLALKINSRIIKAMEEGNTGQLPPRTFLRGFVNSYAAYLKLDIDQLNEVFLNEVDPQSAMKEPTDISIPAQPEAKESSLWQKFGLFKGGSPKFVSSMIGGGAIILVATIVLISRTIEKYQRESKVFAPPENVQALDVKKAPNSAESTVDTANAKEDADDLPDATVEPSSEASTKPETTSTKTDGAPGATKTDSPKVVQVIKPEPTVPALTTKAPEPPPSKTAAPPPAAVKPTAAAAPATPAPAAPPATTTPTVAAPKPATAEPASITTSDQKPATGPQELILEAMDKISIEMQIDGGAAQTFTMTADQIRTLKAKKSLKIKISDGGAVNVIHNGKDMGVPGNLGKPLSLSYPK